MILSILLKRKQKRKKERKIFATATKRRPKQCPRSPFEQCCLKYCAVSRQKTNERLEKVIKTNVNAVSFAEIRLAVGRIQKMHVSDRKEKMGNL